MRKAGAPIAALAFMALAQGQAQGQAKAKPKAKPGRRGP